MTRLFVRAPGLPGYNTESHTADPPTTESAPRQGIPLGILDDHTATQHSSSRCDAVVQASRHKRGPREHLQCSNMLVYRLIGLHKKSQNEPVRSSLASWLGVLRGFGRCIKSFGQPEVPKRMPRHHCSN